MDTFGLPHEISLLNYLEANDAVLVLNHGINQFALAAAFLGQWLHKVWPHNSNPLIICLGVYTEEETTIFETTCRKYPIIDSCGGVNWLGHETTGKDRRKALARGGVFTASHQTWIIDLLQYRIIGSLVAGVLVLNANTLPTRTSSRFIGQLLIASCGSSKLPYFVKALVPDPVSLCTPLTALEKIVTILGLILVASESNIILCPKSAAKITKYVDPVVRKYLKNEQLMNKMTTKIRIIHESLKTLQVRAANQVVSNQDPSVIEELTNTLFSNSAASFLRNVLFCRFIAEKSKEGDYSWHSTPEANMIINAALDRVSSYAENKASLVDMHPRLVPLYQALEKVASSASGGQTFRVLVCLSAHEQVQKLHSFLTNGPEVLITREVFELSIAAQSHDYFPPFVRETLSNTLKKIGGETELIANPSSQDYEEEVGGKTRLAISWRGLSILLVAVPDVSDEVISFRPSHVILSEYSSSWLRQLQYAAARMHSCVDWAFDEEFTNIPTIKTEFPLTEDGPPSKPTAVYRGRRLINARVQYDERSGDAEIVNGERKRRKIDSLKVERDEITSAIRDSQNSAELRAAFRSGFSSRISAHQWVCGGSPFVQCLMVGNSVDAEKFKASLLAEKSAWESLALQRSGLFVIQQKSRAEVYDTLPSEVDKIAYLLTLVAGEGGENVLPISTRRGGGGVAALISALKANVIVPDLAGEEYISSGRAGRRRVESAAVHEILKKSGREIVEAMKTVVLVDIREMRSAVPAALWLSGIRILPLTLETADYILTKKVGIERKSISDLSKSLANGRLLSQVQRLTAQFELPALLIELPGNKFLQSDASYTGSPEIAGSSADPMLIPRLCCLTLGFPKLRMLWTTGEFFTPQLFKLIKRFQPDPTIGDGAPRQRLVESGKIYRSAANSQNSMAADSLVYIPQFSASTCDLAVTNFKNIRALVTAEHAELESAFGKACAAEAENFFRRSYT